MVISKLIEMQKALDEAIYTEHDVKFSAHKTKMAILDEIGELTHELKGDWCWWKKTQAPVNRSKVLEELVDVWHFVLSYHYNALNRDYDERYYTYLQDHYLEEDYVSIVVNLANNPSIEMVSVLSFHLGFSVRDVYDAYIEKNRINYERLERGY